MTTITTDLGQPRRSTSSSIIFDVLERMAQLSPTYRALIRYNDMTDAELAALGMTRADVVHRVFGARLGL